jgi:hypothetical protein
MLNPYSPGRTPWATPPPTTFVENAYWQLIMARWARWRPVDASGSRKSVRTSSVLERGSATRGRPPRQSDEGRALNVQTAPTRLSQTKIVEIIAANRPRQSIGSWRAGSRSSDDEHSPA